MELTNPFRHKATALVAALVLAAAAAAARASGALDAAAEPDDDEAALLAVKSALGDPPALSGWNSSAGFCSWKGVHCNATTYRPRHRPHHLRHQHLGAVPARHRQPHGAAVPQLGLQQTPRPDPGVPGPRGLTFLRLDGNRLSGAIPPTLTVPSLQLVGNRLTGPLPATFADADFFQVDLEDNQLSGDASMLFGAKKRLAAVLLSRNRFAFDLGRVELPEAMDALLIDHNMVYGSIPAAAAARKWAAFDVSYNRLCGPIPQARYTHRFGGRHFAGNKCLCGRPLPPCTS